MSQTHASESYSASDVRATSTQPFHQFLQEQFLPELAGLATTTEGNGAKFLPTMEIGDGPSEAVGAEQMTAEQFRSLVMDLLQSQTMDESNSQGLGQMLGFFLHEPHGSPAALDRALAYVNEELERCGLNLSRITDPAVLQKLNDTLVAGGNLTHQVGAVVQLTTIVSGERVGRVLILLEPIPAGSQWI